MSLVDPFRELLGFLGPYTSIGVVALRYGVLGSARGRGTADPTRAELLAAAGRRASLVGLLGVLLALGLTVSGAVRFATARHHPLLDVLMAGRGQALVQMALYALGAIGFGFVLAGQWAGWALAAIGSVAPQLVGVLSLRWATLVNPAHVLAGSIWIGALFSMVFIAVPTVLRGPQSSDDKALTIADMVNAFSPMALTAVALLVITGVITAVRHLKFVAALWTTSYGMTLVVKLCFVAVVLGLGAWNWRRVRPTLGTPAASVRLQRSARFELTVAGIVLLITSVLVSLPSPRLPR